MLMSFIKSLSLLPNSWLESLKIFAPHNLKLFLLVALKATCETWKALKNIVIQLLLASVFLVVFFVFGNMHFTQIFQDPVMLIFLSVASSSLLEAARPSIDYKNRIYFNQSPSGKIWAVLFMLIYLPYAFLHRTEIKYLGGLLIFAFILLIRPVNNQLARKNRDWEMAIIILFIVISSILFYRYKAELLSFVSSLLSPAFYFFREVVFKVLLINEYSWGIFSYFISPFLLVWILFTLDAQKAGIEYIKAGGRACTMFAFNYPFFAVMYVIFYMLIVNFKIFATWLFPVSVVFYALAWIIFGALVVPFYYSLITNFYIKRLHDQFGLYY